jgi:hypothetical protein
LEKVCWKKNKNTIHCQDLEGFNLKRSVKARTIAVKKCSVTLMKKISVEGSWERESSLLVLDVMGRKWLEWDEKSEKEGGGMATEGLKEVGVVQMPRVVFFVASWRAQRDDS